MESVLHLTPAMLLSMLTTTWHLWLIIGPHFPTTLGIENANTQLLRIHSQSWPSYLPQSKGMRITNSNIINTYHSKDDSIFFKPKTKKTSRSNESKHFMSSNIRDSKGNDYLNEQINHESVHTNQDILFKGEGLLVEKASSHSKKRNKNYIQDFAGYKNSASTSMQQNRGNRSSFQASSINNKTKSDHSHASLNETLKKKPSVSRENTGSSQPKMCNTTGNSDRLDMEFTSTVVDNGKVLL